MKKSKTPRRVAALILAVLMCFGIVAGALALILPAFAADSTDINEYAPSGSAAVSVGAAVNISVSTNQKKGSENTYEMPTEKWGKKYLTDGSVSDGYGWSCDPYDREMNQKTPVTVTLKLASAADITGVTLFPHCQFPNTYEIQVSSDGKTFKTMASDSGIAPSNKENKTYLFDAANVTHVRFHITDRNPATGGDGALAQLGEIAVWGKAQDSMKLDRSAIELFVNETDTLTPIFAGVSGSPAVTFKSADSTVVSVDASGKLTAKKVGKTIVTATCASPKLTATCTVEVVEKKHDFNENIMISIFWPPTPEYITDEQYKLMADAGINWVMGAGEETLATPENQAKMLELCAKYGMGMTINDGNFGDNVLGKSEAQIAQYVAKYHNVPAAYGFYMRDEPVNPNAYIDAYIALKKAAPEAYMHLNFLPQGAYGTAANYKAQMNDWCALTAAAGYPIEYLMFDQYPFGLQAGTMNRSGFFENTRSCWEIGLKNGVKTGMYIQTVQQDVAFRRPEASAIRYEMYAALAFGYKQLSFFTWFTPVNRSEPFSDGIISADGKPNEHYETVKTLNHEILAIGETLVGCDALEVWFNGRDTYGQPAVPADFFVQAGKSDSVILSFLRHKETGRNYLMVVNNEFMRKQEVELTFDSAIKSLSEVSREDGSLKPLSMDGQKLTIEFPAGDAILIALPEGYDYYKAPEGQPDATVNLAADANVTCPTSQGSDGWYIYNLTDGARLTGTISSACGWKTADHNDSYIQLDLGRTLDFNRIDLYSAGTFFDHGQNFPKTIKISVSADGKTFTEVKTVSDLTPAKLSGDKITFDTQTARYIRLDLTGAKRSDKYVALNEIEVYCDNGTVPAPETFTLTGISDIIVDYKEGENIALNKPAFASSTTPDHYAAWGWALEFINNGVTVNSGWTSNVGRNNNANATEYVGIDFCDVFAVDKIVISPLGAFPIDYTVELSVDGVEWTVISDVKGASRPTSDVILTLDTPVNGRFLRMTATKLAFGGNQQDGYLFQLGEIEAYGKPVCDTTELTAAVELYKAEGGDESAQLYTDVLAALENPLLTQTRADDYIKKLYAAVGYAPETEAPETETETDPDVETPSESDPESEIESTPAETGEPDTGDANTDESVTATPDAEKPDSGAATDDGKTDDANKKKGGCASLVGAGFAVILTAGSIAAVTLRKRRED